MSFRKSRYHLSHRICRTILLSLARSSSTVTSLVHLINNIGSLSLIHAKPPFQMDAKRQTKLSQFDRDTYTRSNVSLSVTKIDERDATFIFNKRIAPIRSISVHPFLPRIFSPQIQNGPLRPRSARFTGRFQSNRCNDRAHVCNITEI